ncbi:MAG: glycosyltransferase family 2 protein [Eubacteriales bacterium]|nr:glycosyltransferase family 2 protein [Eubacteriales bacterium]
MKSMTRTILYFLENHLPGLVKRLVTIRSWLKPLDCWTTQRLSVKLAAQLAESGILSAELATDWNAAFRTYHREFPRNYPIYASFCTSQLDRIARRKSPDLIDQVLGICVVKNDLERMKLVIEHYRTLGVLQFAIIDNDSTDGTKDWLTNQPDMDVYVVTTPFSSQRKYGWINQLLARYGRNRWYLYFDSDERFVYPDLENKPIARLIAQVERHQLDRLGAVMLDMYSDQAIYAKTPRTQPITADYCYFDSDSYEISQSRRGTVIKGGPRKRVFSAELDDSPLLIKYPLFFLREGMIFESAHYLYPFRHDIPVGSALLHYKFLPSDLERHLEIAREGNFQGGSREYKRYLAAYEANAAISFLYDGTVKFENSSSLARLGFVQTLEDSEVTP